MSVRQVLFTAVDQRDHILGLDRRIQFRAELWLIEQTGQAGPWLAGMTLEPSVVYEAWCSQRPREDDQLDGGIIVMIEEIHGKPVKAGQSFSAAHIVGYFDTIEEMH